MFVLKTRAFVRSMRKSGVSDDILAKAVAELANGLHDGDLGGGVYKKRIPAPGQGKRGGYRTIIATRAGIGWFFLYGYKKNEQSNIDEREVAALKELASDLFELSSDALQIALRDGLLMEVKHARH